MAIWVPNTTAVECDVRPDGQYSHDENEKTAVDC